MSTTPNDESNNDDNTPEIQNRRRNILLSLTSAIILQSTTLLPPTVIADDEVRKNKKIVVFGGSGYVGAHVLQLLTQKDNIDVVSVSRSSPTVQSDKIKKIINTDLPKIQYLSLDASKDDLIPALQDATSVISLIGIAPGGKNQRDGNGAVNVRIVQQAKQLGTIHPFVYASISSELANGPAKFLLGDYFKGKAEAEAAVMKEFGGTEGDAVVVKPDFIEGGPPGEIRPPGPPGVKAVSVEDVAKVVVGGVLGELGGDVIDGNGAIVKSASSL